MERQRQHRLAAEAGDEEPVSETDDGPSYDHPACQPGGSLYGIAHAHAAPAGQLDSSAP